MQQGAKVADSFRAITRGKNLLARAVNPLAGKIYFRPVLHIAFYSNLDSDHFLTLRREHRLIRFNYNTFKRTGIGVAAARSLFCCMGRKWASPLIHRSILLNEASPIFLKHRSIHLKVL